MTTTLLLIAYAFPPEHLVGAARPYRFYRYLPEFGVKPVVITASPQTEQRADVAFVRDMPRDRPRETFSWQVERVFRKFALPGEEGLVWSWAAASEALRRAPAGGRTVVMSTAPPISVHFAGMRVARKLGIPWIADFRDPMDFSQVVGRRWGIYPALESIFMNRADAVIANTDAVQKLWRARYPGRTERIHAIYNGFDPAEEIVVPELPKRQVRHLVHMGELYAGRHPRAILDSMERLHARGTLPEKGVRFSIMGRVTDEAIAQYEPLHRLRAKGLVDYDPSLIPKERAREIAVGADALVLLHHSGLQVPGKMYEYVRIGRPVLAYLTPDSPSERILAGSGLPFRAIYPDDAPEVVDAKLMEFLSFSNEATGASPWFDTTFNGREQSRTLAALVESVADAAGAR